MKKLEKVYAHVFFLFFVAQILSPSINGRTIYLEWIVAVLNPYFWQWLRNKHYKMTSKLLYIILALGFIAGLGHFSTSLKLMICFFSIIYLNYLYTIKLWKIYPYLYISVFLAVMQIALFAVDPQMALAIGPNAISEFIWGSYATATLTNFYDAMGLGFIRVSGLSREAGFLASLIVVMLFTTYLEIKQGEMYKKSTLTMLFVGYLVSFSKMSIILLPLFLLHKLRRLVNHISIGNLMLAFVILMIIFWSYNVDYLLEYEHVTFLHRFGAYVSISDLDLSQFLLGTNLGKLNSLPSHDLRYVYPDLDFFAGFGGWIIQAGIITAFLWVFILYQIGISSTGMLIILLLTINVQPDTNQNFVCIAYFIAYKFYHKYNLPMKKDGTDIVGSK